VFGKMGISAGPMASLALLERGPAELDGLRLLAQVAESQGLHDEAEEARRQAGVLSGLLRGSAAAAE